MDRDDFEAFLRKQLWCDRCHGVGYYTEFPDSLMGKYPMVNIELKSMVADVLLMSAYEMPQGG